MRFQFVADMDIIKNLIPYIKFKENQARAMYRAAVLLSKKKSGKLIEKDFRSLVDCIIIIQENNYITKRKKSKKELLKILDLTP